MARRDRMRSRQWHFSDSGGRFDKQRRYKPTIDHAPISATFTRKIMHCKRCGSRVVSNVSHCPYCGKSLLPLYRRFWVWLIIVALIGAGVAALLFYSPGIKTEEEPTEPSVPFVINAPEGTSYKNLELGKTVGYNMLNVTVSENQQVAISSNGVPITTVEVHFYNSGQKPVTLYSTQWQLQSIDGTRVDCFIGKTNDGESIRSELESYTLGPGSTYTTVFYFAVQDPYLVVFAPNVLSYLEDELVTWILVVPPDEVPNDEDL